MIYAAKENKASQNNISRVPDLPYGLQHIFFLSLITILAQLSFVGGLVAGIIATDLNFFFFFFSNDDEAHSNAFENEREFASSLSLLLLLLIAIREEDMGM